MAHASKAEHSQPRVSWETWAASIAFSLVVLILLGIVPRLSW